MSVPKVRLYVDQPLNEGQSVVLTRDQAHYLSNVMRLEVGARIAVFNGIDGENAATVSELTRKGGALACGPQLAPLAMPPDLWLLFAPIKKARTDFIVEKAVELGVRRIVPVQTEFTNSERIRRDRLQAHAVEAAEQCGATYVPEVCEMVRLERLLDDWQADRGLLFCDEAASGGDLPAGAQGPWAILIGPEGGFSDAERRRLAELPTAHVMRLGPRILRADTAAVAALTLWQAALGDWR